MRPSKEQTKLPAELILERLERLKEDARRHGWGDLVSEVVLGNEVFYHFRNGTRAVFPLP